MAHIFICGVIFIGLDAIWIAGIANRFYKDQLHRYLADKPNFVAAAAFYIIYLWALLYFALEPALRTNDLAFLLKHAAMLGLVAYATYDLTNLSTLKKWPLKLTFVDIAWGVFLTTAVALIGFGVFPSTM